MNLKYLGYMFIPSFAFFGVCMYMKASPDACLGGGICGLVLGLMMMQQDKWWET